MKTFEQGMANAANRALTAVLAIAGTVASVAIVALGLVTKRSDRWFRIIELLKVTVALAAGAFVCGLVSSLFPHSLTYWRAWVGAAAVVTALTLGPMLYLVAHALVIEMTDDHKEPLRRYFDETHL